MNIKDDLVRSLSLSDYDNSQAVFEKLEYRDPELAILEIFHSQGYRILMRLLSPSLTQFEY